VTVVRVHVLYCDSGTWTWSVLCQWYVYMLCVVPVVRVHAVCCDSGTCTCCVLWQWYVYMLCVATVVRVHAVCCDSGTCTCCVLWQWYARKKNWKSLLYSVQTGSVAYLASFSIVTGDTCLGGKAAGCQVSNTPSPSAAKLKNSWSYTSIPPCLFYNCALSSPWRTVPNIGMPVLHLEDHGFKFVPAMMFT
jgi:hypothetical protein